MNHIRNPEITITVTTTATAVQDDERWQTQDSPCFPRPLCVALPPKIPHRQVSVATGGGAISKEAVELPAKPSTPPPSMESAALNIAMLQNSPPRLQVSEAAAPRRPRRRVTLEGAQPSQQELPLLPPQRPIRQPTADIGAFSSHSDFASRDVTETIEEEMSDDDDDISLSQRFDESMRLSTSARFLQDDSHRMSTSTTRFNQSLRLEECCGESKLEGSSRDLSPSRPRRQKSAPMDVSGHNNNNKSTGGIALAGQPPQPEWVKLWESQGPGNTSLSNLWSF